MKRFCRDHLDAIAVITVIAVCLAFFTYTLSLFTGYSDDVGNIALERAEFYTKEASFYVQGKIDAIKAEAENYARLLSPCANVAELKAGIKNALSGDVRDQYITDILYFKDGCLFLWDGEEYYDSASLSELNADGDITVVRQFLYNGRMNSVAVSVNAENAYFDRLVAVFDVNSVSLDRTDISEFTLLCKNDGRIMDRLENKDTFNVGNQPVQNGIIKSLFGADPNMSDTVSQTLLGDNDGSFTFTRDTENYILCISHLGAYDGDLTLMCMYSAREVYGEGFAAMQSIMSALLGLALVMAVLIIMIIVNRIIEKRRRYRLEMVDPLLNCPTAKKFVKRSDDLLKTYRSSKFAFVSLKINNFRYVTEHFGDNAGRKLLKYASDTVRGALMVEETFGYALDSEFLMLLQYRDRKSFSERLNGVYLRLSDFDEFDALNYKISVAFAVYEIEHGKDQKIRSMLDKLKMAEENMSVKSEYLSISFYEDMMHERYIKKAEIEGKMEQALQNSEFHLFYQPKYNLRSKNMDGCEILIRWYDPELMRYHLPQEFLPVFEKNLFIVKLDHFVFFKACENIARTVEQRQICYPVSVNVSRVTAIQSDFTDYYIRIKKKFNIKDNFITLEFTESFAYENYEFLSDIVKKLHDNGFMCSIDDFGTGYSSYNILKTIKMDEIKLDKFFLDKGISADRDQLLLESVIDMVKKLGMKVTQEGVETKEDLYRLEKLGCDVIQGYYFAKPMKYSDFCDFVKTNFS